ncbi:MAG: sigma-70 family RNA polymerase sigma factor [Acidobacteria bacterium]|nr:sigma-70 family RNA polymerase sigma factor [Acidobacteriota bacterium]
MRPELIDAVSLLHKNDAESVEEAIRLLQGTVYAFSMKVCGHPQDAEDTMQDVLFGSLAHLAKIRDAKALAVWLYTVTRNRCWRSRRRALHAPKQTLSLDELMPDEIELADLLQGSGQNPEQQLLAREQNELLHKAILSVPPEYRLVLVLHDVEDLDTEQVAQVLGLLPGTVRVRLHRARLYVRKAMAALLERASSKTAAERPSYPRRRKARSSRASRQRPPECRTIFANLSEYLDGRLKPESCDNMRQHIEACPACVAFIGDLCRAIDRCRTLAIDGSSDLAPRLRSMLTGEYLRLLSTPVAEK